MLEVVSRRKAMQVVAGAAAALGCTGSAMAGESDRQREDKAHCEWLTKIAKQIKTIKVGMSRSDVEKLKEWGVNTILVGESLVTADDTLAKMKELML